MSFRENIGPDGPTPKQTMTYRILKAGEIIREGDEWTHHYGEGAGEKWQPVKNSIGMFLSDVSTLRYRRAYEPDMCLNEGYDDDDNGYGTEFFGASTEYVGPESLSKKPTRKEMPVYSGCLKYFPDALMAVANCSYVGNEQHNPGSALRWDRSKSGDELDALVRHLAGAGTVDSDGVRHSAKVAWRALANLQKEIENDQT